MMVGGNENPAARAKPDGGVGWFGSVFRRRRRTRLQHKRGDGGAPGAGALGIDGADAETLVLPTGVRGRVSEALVMLRMGVRS